MTREEKELLELKFKGVYQHQKANFDSISTQLGQILALGEGNKEKIDKIEKETRFFRWVEKNPRTSVVLGVLIVAGFIAVGTVIGWHTIISKLI